MKLVSSLLNNLPKNKKLILVLVLIIITIIVSFSIPTIARRNNRAIINSTPTWDGSIASKYNSGDGTEGNPYIISNASEFAYFSEMLKTTNYENTYFKLINNIVINAGVFNYDTVDGVKYTIANNTYYVDYYSNKYYDNVNRYGTSIGEVNIFNPIDNFKGTFDFNYYTIYGLYLTSNQNDEVALFTNLEGTIKNLYTKNLMVYGGSYTGGIASIAKNATLKDIVVDGNVVSNTVGITKTLSNKLNDLNITLTSTNTAGNIDLSNDIPFVGSEIISTTLKGNYTVNGSENATIKINDNVLSGGSFEIDLGTSILNDVSYSISSDLYENTSVDFTNITYEIVYKYTTTGGVIGYSTNSNISNLVNNANVYGNYNAGGIIGTITNIKELSNSYNTGIVSSNKNSGGIIGSVNKNKDGLNIYNVYNTGNITGISGGLVGKFLDNTGPINIYNSFDTSDTYIINSVINSNVSVSNTYYINNIYTISTGSINGTFTNTLIDNLKSKDFIKNTLLFNEYISKSDLSANKNNVWVYDNSSYPILYIDDLKNPIASIHVSSYLWNNCSDDVNKYNFNTDIKFIITDTIENTVKEKYYYISNKVLTKDELELVSDWNSYTQVTNVTTEGSNIIYAKIVDNNDNVTFINSDELILDKAAPEISIKVLDKSYTSLNTNLSNVYLSSSSNIEVTASDLLSGVSSISYYISSSLVENDKLSTLEWTNYKDGILIDTVGKYVIYTKVVDNSGNISYANTDYIIYDGYKMTLSIGENNSYGDNYNISYKSSIKAVFEHSSTDSVTGIHNLVSSILYPSGTKLILIDHNTNKTYKYSITSSMDSYGYASSCKKGTCRATYPFSLFREVGTNTKMTFKEYAVTNEKYTILVDYSEVNVRNDYSNVSTYLELVKNNEVILSTLDNIKTYNIYAYANYVLTDASLLLEGSYNGSALSFNSDSTTNIDITTGISYKNINSNDIIDTTYENKELGLAISMTDAYGSVINKEYLKNISFMYNDNIYTFGTDNYVHINLGKGIKKSKDVISIITNKDSVLLKSGNYYFRIYVYASYDGNYHDSLSTNYISVPINVVKTLNSNDYLFNVTMNNSDRIISKDSDTYPITFNAKVGSNLSKPNIKVELYKKDLLSAYNQDYSLVDLVNYTSNKYTRYKGNMFTVLSSIKESSDITITLLPNELENTGYKFVFYLYDGDTFISAIDTKVIVR